MVQLSISEGWLTLKREGRARTAPHLSVSWFNLPSQKNTGAEVVNRNCSQKGVMCAGHSTGRMARAHAPLQGSSQGSLRRNGVK